jgi:cobalt/nickel transport system permease protein
VLFQFGGITTLGVNTIIMALPAVLSYMAFRPLITRTNPLAMMGAFACGFLSVFFGAVMVGLGLFFTEENFLQVAGVVVAAHLPVMVIEGVITALCVAFLRKVQSELLPQKKV